MMMQVERVDRRVIRTHRISLDVAIAATHSASSIVLLRGNKYTDSVPNDNASAIR